MVRSSNFYERLKAFELIIQIKDLSKSQQESSFKFDQYFKRLI